MSKEQLLKFEEALKNHDLEDLERILEANDRKRMNPLFYNFVRKKIRQKKRNPIIFIQYHWEKLLGVFALLK